MAQSAVNPWIAASRPKTLVASLIPVAVGCALAYRSSPASFRPFLAIIILCCALAIQIATNFFNDYYDFIKGADTPARTGPLRASQAGLLPPPLVLRAACGALLCATILGAYLIAEGGIPILVIGLLSLFFAYGYTSGPFPLAYLGLGDIFVLVFFGQLAVMGSEYLLSGNWTMHGLVAGSQIGLLAVVLIAINNLRDIENDRISSKKTLAVRFGIMAARMEIAAALLLPFIAGVYWAWYGMRTVALLPLLALPSALSLLGKVWRTEPSAVFNNFLAKAALVHLLFGLFLCVGILW